MPRRTIVALPHVAAAGAICACLGARVARPVGGCVAARKQEHVAREQHSRTNQASPSHGMYGSQCSRRLGSAHTRSELTRVVPPCAKVSDTMID